MDVKFKVYSIVHHDTLGEYGVFADEQVAQFWTAALNYDQHVIQRKERAKQTELRASQDREFDALVKAGLRDPNEPRFGRATSGTWYEDNEAAGRWPNSPFYVNEIEVY